MKIKHWTRALVLSTLAVTAFAPVARAQDEEDEPAPRTKAAAGPTCPGRNDTFCKAFEDVAQKVNGSVVSVGGAAYGVVLEGGVIVTTSEAAKAASRVKVKGPGVSGEARVIGVDENDGIGVLEAPEGAAGLAVSTGELTIGQFVISVGTSGRPLAVGVLSAKDRKVEPKDISQANLFMGLLSDGLDGPKRGFPKVLQHDGPMNDETLGSPIVDSDGHLIGINVGTGFRGSSYALAASDLLAAVKALRAGAPLPERAPSTEERPAKRPSSSPAKRPYLGASIIEQDGKLVVKELADGSPAYQAGLHPGDKVVAFDGVKVASLDDLAACFKGKKPGDTVEVEIDRAGSATKLNVVLGEKK